MEPIMSDTIPLHDSLHMEADILGSGKLYGYSVSLTNTSNQNLLFNAATEERKRIMYFIHTGRTLYKIQHLWK